MTADEARAAGRRTEVEEALTIAAVAEDLFARPRRPREQALALRSIIDAGKGLPGAKLEQIKAHLLARAERVEAETEWIEEVEGEVVVADGWPDPGGVDWIPALANAAEALRLTAEYVGPDGLPSIEGWSWWQALVEARDVLGWDALPADWREPRHSPEVDPGPDTAESDEHDRTRRATAAVDDLVVDRDDVDLEELRGRVHGDG